MVQVPLARLGLDVSTRNMPGVIHRESRGRPEIVQCPVRRCWLTMTTSGLCRRMPSCCTM